MRSNQVVRAPDRQWQSRNCPGFDPSILRHSGILGAADETGLKSTARKSKNHPKKLNNFLDRFFSHFRGKNRYNVLTSPACCPSCRHQSHARNPPRERLLQTGTPPYKLFTHRRLSYCLKRSRGEKKDLQLLFEKYNAYMRVQIFRNLSGRLFKRSTNSVI